MNSPLLCATAMSEAQDIELLFAIWEQNVETVRAISRSMKQDHLPKSGIAPQLVAHLKRCAIALAKPQRTTTQTISRSLGNNLGERSTRASSPSVNRSGSDARSTFVSSPASLARFVAGRPLTRTTCDTRKRAD